VIEVRRIMKTVLRVRGMTTVWADHTGLRFENAPGRVKHGTLRREDFGHFMVVIETKTFVKLMRLEARRGERGAPQPLFVSTNQALLLRIARVLLEGMGRALPRAEAVE